MSEKKTQTIVITLTSDEVNALEDGIWCENSNEWYTENHKCLSSAWYKIATEFDKPSESNNISHFKALAEKWRSTEKSHNGVRCHAWKICADELEALVKEMQK